MNRGTADSFLRDGCGRCERYRTPECKVHRFPEVLRELRELLQDSELTETMKWGAPCYVLGKGNVVALVARKSSAGLGFFKGSLLEDTYDMLVAPGPNSQASRELRFTSTEQLAEQRAQVRHYLDQAVAIEKAGRTVVFKKGTEPVPGELLSALDADPMLQAAWDGLTLGRRRSHILHVGGAKLSKTRHDRVGRCVRKILAGKGWNER